MLKFLRENNPLKRKFHAEGGHLKHEIGSIMLSIFAYAVFSTHPWFFGFTEIEFRLMTFFSVMAFGLIKELTDFTGFQKADILANTIGCLVFQIVLLIFIH